MPYGTVSAVSRDLLEIMDKVVVDDWREARAGRFGALRHHVDTGKLQRSPCTPNSARWSRGEARPGKSPEERILLWHRGLSILDVAVGQLILERAVAADTGTMLRYR